MSQVDEWNRQQRDRLEVWKSRSRRIRADLDEIQVRMSSRDGAVEVSVDARGLVTGIELAPRALRTNERELSQQLMELLRDAQAEASRQAGQLISEDPEIREFADAIRKLSEED